MHKENPGGLHSLEMGTSKRQQCTMTTMNTKTTERKADGIDCNG